MTIAQYLPQWLRNRLLRPAPPKATNRSKKDRQILPTLRKAPPPPVRLADEDSALRFRIYWRM
jgi:hypothetical protein